ncbi:hypothetical protein CPB86DRAFT_839288 [Serendipita vermifera]|nr:hypothetical protein CPB86DRAFT_839288 [Serendipita vermifera]
MPPKKDMKVGDLNDKVSAGAPEEMRTVPSISEKKLPKNPVLDPTERLSMLGMISEDRNHVIFLSDQIKTKRCRIEMMENRLKDAEKGLLIGKNLQLSIQCRIDENTARITKLSAARESLNIDVKSSGLNASPTSRTLHKLIVEYVQEEETARKAKAEDTRKLGSIAAQIESWTAQIEVDRFIIAQEGKTIGSLQACHDQLVLSIAENEVMTSSSHLLPDEVLMQIFCYVLDNAINTVREDITAPQDHSAMKLSWICTRMDLGRQTKLFGGGNWISQYQAIECTDPLSSYLDLSVGAKAILDNARVVELIGRNTKFAVDCKIITPHYIIRELSPRFHSTVAAKLTNLSLFVSEMALSTVNTILERLPQGVLSGTMAIITPVTLLRLTDLSATPSVISQLIGKAIETPNLSCVEIEEENQEQIMMSQEQWELCVHRADMKAKISRLVIAGIASEERVKKEILPKIVGWVGVNHLVLRGKNLSPILEAMEANTATLPNVEQLKLEGTDISGDIIRKTFDSRKHGHGGGQKERVCKTINKLVLNRCQGVDRAFCEDMMQRIDEMAVYC